MWISPKIKKFVVKDGRENRHIFFNSVLKYSNNEKTDYNSYCGVTDESLNKLKWFESLESVRNAEIIFFFPLVAFVTMTSVTKSKLQEGKL